MVLDLHAASCQADEMCLVYCKAQASLRLDCEEAVLVRLTTTDNQERIIWLDSKSLTGEVFTFSRAFYEPEGAFEVDVGNIKTIEPIVPDNDIFCYNGHTYYLHKALNGNDSIRRLRALCSQSVVEQVERQTYQKSGIIESIFLSNFYLIEDNKRNYALTLWGIVYPDCCNYLPVFEEDHHFLSEYNLSAFDRQEVRVGEIFKNNGYYYKLQQNDAGKLFLESSKMVFTLNKNCEIKKPPEYTNARIIMMNCRK